MSLNKNKQKFTSISPKLNQTGKRKNSKSPKSLMQYHKIKTNQDPILPIKFLLPLKIILNEYLKPSGMIDYSFNTTTLQKIRQSTFTNKTCQVLLKRLCLSLKKTTQCQRKKSIESNQAILQLSIRSKIYNKGVLWKGIKTQ